LLRKLGEMLGIGGLAGRSSAVVNTNPLQPAANPYAALPSA
jgi:hypothetical protein